MFRHCMLYALVMFLASCLLPVTARAAEDPLKYEGLRGQYVNAMALVPDGRVMVATNAGVWEFAKNGAPVSLLPDTGMPRKMEECAIEQVVVNSKGNVFIAVGPNKGSPSLRGGDGVFRMDPKNARWTQVGKDVLLQAKSETIQSVAVLPDDTLFCVVKGVKAKDGDLSCFKLFRSTNNGDTWQYLLPPDPAGFFGISIVPGPNRQLWLSTSGVHQSANRVSFSSWIGIADDWQATPLKWHVNSLQSGDHKIGTEKFPGDDLRITRLAFNRQGHAYALVTQGQKTPYIPGVYRSTDKGATWQRVTSDKEAGGERLAMVVTPDDHIYVNSYGGILCSKDNGTTWTAYDSFSHTNVTDFLIDHAGHLWVATGSTWANSQNPGVWRSTAPVGRGVDVPATAKVPTKDPLVNPAPETKLPVREIVSNFNDGGVKNSPTKPEAKFHLKNAYDVTTITTYHWNDRKGIAPGTITLKDENGKLVGRWQAEGRGAAGGVSNVYWDAHPNTTLQPGVYTISVSSPETWSWNTETDGAGMFQILGQPKK